ncbi:MAG: hypothetical protein RBT13_04840 [Bacteroidales bacterium]|jgi:hypothetical protein|nr:hypothetical protein [Bacteroidales bacterium]NLO42415.1 hypothetical protein [Bacteroidales bacterium]
MKSSHSDIIKYILFIAFSASFVLTYAAEKGNAFPAEKPTTYYSFQFAREQVLLIGYNIGFPLIAEQIRVSPCELYVGMVSEVGFYAKFKSNFNFNTRYNSKLVFTSDFKDIEKIRYHRLGALVGVYLHLSEPVYAYFGIGYGSRKQMIQVNCYNDQVGAYPEYYYYNRYRSVELEAGTTLRFQELTLSLGAAMLPIGNKIPYFEIHAGMGVVLPIRRF